MKHFRKMVSVMLTIAMVATMMISLASAEALTYTISAKSDDSHTYLVYQIFKGEVADGKLTNVTAGKNFATNAEVDEALTALETVNTATATDTDILAVVKNYCNMNGEAYDTVTKDSSAENVEPGYYLIKDNGSDTDAVRSLFVVKVVSDNITINPKRATAPEFQKKIKDRNDTTNVASDDFHDNDTDYTAWQDSADYDIGDKIPYQLKATVPADVNNYGTYKMVFHDKADAGLTFNEDVKLYVNGVEQTAGFEVVPATDGDTFDVVIANVKSIAAANDVITVEYTMTLNEDAILGNAGNVNEAKLQYSNNPNVSGTGENGDTNETTETTVDKVIAFTYQVVINKVDQDDTALSGADFTLEKVLKDGSKVSIAKVSAIAGSVFTFKGIDDGNYVLTETTTPDGYNSIAPIEFTVSATHNPVWETFTEDGQKAVLSALTGSVTTGSVTFAADDTLMTLSTKVINKAGSTLPTTGGMGTTILYIIGGILVLGAGVALITKKRAENER